MSGVGTQLGEVGLDPINLKETGSISDEELDVFRPVDLQLLFFPVIDFSLIGNFKVFANRDKNQTIFNFFIPQVRFYNNFS